MPCKQINTLQQKLIFHSLFGCCGSSLVQNSFTIELKRFSWWSIGLLHHFRLVTMPPTRKVNFPCGVCDKRCGDDTILCGDCATWVHRNCVPLTANEFDEFSSEERSFYCPRCMGRKDNGVFDWTVAQNRSVSTFHYLFFISSCQFIYFKTEVIWMHCSLTQL
jgi:hypothetical protein